jgi:nucleosome binding factor SPN SPT16 subunit
VDGFAFIVGKSNEEDDYSKIMSFQIWAFGYELPDTLVALTRRGIYVISSAKKIKFLEPLKQAATASLPVHFLERHATNNAANFDTVLATLNGGKLGDLGPKNAGTGPFADEWKGHIERSSNPRVVRGKTARRWCARPLTTGTLPCAAALSTQGKAWSRRMWGPP